MKIFNDLMALTAVDPTKFFFVDTQTPVGTKVRVFSYNFASYSDWVLPSALECRGIMFEIDDEQKPVRIMARPMEKFFNLNETPFTMNLDFSKVQHIALKADGSLISSFVDKDALFFKSKTSMISDQALAASALIRREEHDKLYRRLLELGQAGYTVNMEYVAPTNRIVLAYQEAQLIILNVRHNETGEYNDFAEIFADSVLRPYMTETYAKPEDMQEFIDSTYNDEGIEGYVVYMSDGTKFKLKTKWYVALHHTKDSITNNERLFNAVALGSSDDLRTMFTDDEYSLGKILAFEEAFLSNIGRMTREVLQAYEDLRHEDRRNYAVKGQERFIEERFLFNVLMLIFGNGSHEKATKAIQEFFLKNYQRYIPEQFR